MKGYLLLLILLFILKQRAERPAAMSDSYKQTNKPAVKEKDWTK